MRWLLAAVALLAWTAPAAAQRQDTSRLPTGVKLDLLYNTMRQPLVAVRPFAAPPDAQAVAAEAHAIITQDLDFSDRYVIAEVPEALKAGPVTLAAWNDLGVVYLLTAEAEPDGAGFLLRLALHDVPFGSLKEIQAFHVPAPSDEGFRMAIHALSDEVVRWISGQPGMAASRIAFVRGGRGREELMVLDADGENLERIASAELIYSPAWSPDGKRIAYTAMIDGTYHLIERDLETGRSLTVVAGRPGVVPATPTYSPDGRRLVYAMLNGSTSEMREYDLERRSTRNLTRSRADDISPTYSPDGQRLAFSSTRLGIGVPQIYVMPADGGDATLLSPFVYGEGSFYTSPDWSPSGSHVAFHGKSRGGWFQIMVADAASAGAPVNQITQEGENEDPSWAPDGRHLVFTSVRAGGQGLYVVDTFTGRERLVHRLEGAKVPDWSPALRRAAELAIRGR